MTPILRRKICSSNRKGLLSVNCRRQALSLCLDAAAVVIAEIFDEFLLEVLHGFKLLQIKELAHKAETLFSKHPLILYMLVLPALVRMKDQRGAVRYLLKRLVQYCCYHAQRGPVSCSLIPWQPRETNHMIRSQCCNCDHDNCMLAFISATFL